MLSTSEAQPRYFGLRGSAVRLWQLIEEKAHTEEALGTRLMQEFAADDATIRSRSTSASGTSRWWWRTPRAAWRRMPRACVRHNPDDPVLNKFVLSYDGGAEADVPLRAVYVIGERGARYGHVRVEPLQPVARLHALIAHASDDPAASGSHGAPAPREALEAAVSMVRSVDLKTVSMPNGISRGLDLSAL